jgi:hypothetical protein
MGLEGRPSEWEGMGRTARFTLIAYGVLIALAVFLLTGCERTNPPVERQEKGEGIEQAMPKQKASLAPAYDITLENDFVERGLSVKRYDVSTGATSGEDFEAITADLWAKSSGYQVVQVVFFAEKNSTTEVSRGAGFAFKNEQVARKTLTEATPQGTNVEERVRKAMENGGIYVISVADELREAKGG